MVCEKCGYELDEQDEFCSGCGKKVNKKAETVATVTSAPEMTVMSTIENGGSSETEGKASLPIEATVHIKEMPAIPVIVKKQRKKYVWTTIIAVALILVVCLLNLKPHLNEATIKASFDNYTLAIEEPVQITSVEVLKRESEKRNDTSYCEIRAKGTVAEYIAFYTVEYAYYDKGGWIVESISPCDYESWTATYLDSGLVTKEEAKQEFDFSGLPLETGFNFSTVFEQAPEQINTDSGAVLAHIFTGEATYLNEICQISARTELLYFYECGWDEGVYSARWIRRPDYGGLVDSDVNVDLSGTWVGNTLPQKTFADANEYCDRSAFSDKTILTIGIDDEGSLCGTLECVVPYIDFRSSANKEIANEKVDLGATNLFVSASNGVVAYDNIKNWDEPFILVGDANDNLEDYLSSAGKVRLENLKLDVVNKIITGRYRHSYGTSFDVTFHLSE